LIDLKPPETAAFFFSARQVTDLRLVDNGPLMGITVF
jgi:hypothetical protein